ncbi:expansin C-terminal domain-related protein [Streptomyces sp. 4F14]|uniref:expansin C-terminal domain-related protein n=1 Tax=Streptomyces sp. 4F14 TaxID=3394380 RepID=UPI003A8C265B
MSVRALRGFGFLAAVSLLAGTAFTASAAEPGTRAADGPLLRGTAGFYGGADASGTMGGACGYGNLYDTGFGTNTAAVSADLFNDGLACGRAYKVVCDEQTAAPQACKPGTSVTVRVTNLAPPLLNGSPALFSHFDLAQPAYEQIANTSSRSVPMYYQAVPAVVNGGVRFTINGRSYFNLVLVHNVGGAGAVQAMWVKGSGTNWMSMSRNWGANFQSLSYLNGQSLSFRVQTIDGVTLTFPSVVPANWSFGQTFTGSTNF